MATHIEARPLNTLCRKCQQSFPCTGPWPGDNGSGCFTFERSIGPYNYKISVVRSAFTIDELDGSIAAEGCHLCRVLLDSLLPKSMVMSNYHDYPSWRVQHKHIKYDLLFLADNRHKPGTFMKIHSGTSSVDMDIFFKRLSPGHTLPHNKEANLNQVWTMQAGSSLFKDQNSVPSSATVISQPSSSTTFDPLVLAQIRRWVDECTQEHEACRMSTAANQLIVSEFQSKVRFIDIGLDESVPLRLVEGIKEERVKYITLSYRWTAETPMTSMKSFNKAAYHTSIPTENWPKVYKDLVFLSRVLGVRYVWIDSLCIIQDDLQDWNVQASLMHRIYTHGYINFAGACGEFSAGLEVIRDPRSVSPCILPRIRLNDVPEFWACYTGDSPALELKHAPLYSRGWCYQERFLSTRTIHFSQQLYWECKTRQASEAFASSTTNEHPDVITILGQAVDQSHSYSWPKKPIMDPSVLWETWPTEAILSPSALWEKIIEDYSESEFTKYSDRLVALRGIFNSFWERFDGSQDNDWCVAGLWKRCMTRQWLWAYSHSAAGHDRFDKNQDTKYYMRMERGLANFPSWSWASCPTSPRLSHIEFPRFYRDTCIEDLVEIESIVPLNHDAFDEGYPAFESAAIILQVSYIGLSFEVDGLLQNWKRSWRPYSAVKVWGPNSVGLEENTALASMYLDRPLLRPVQPKDLQLLPIQLRYDLDKRGFWFSQAHGILVEAQGTRDNIPTFRRVGKWNTVHRGDRGDGSRIIPGLPDRCDSKESLEAEMAEFRKRRKRLPKLRFMLV